MDAVEIALEEYKSLRQESLMALERQHTVLRFGIGLVGVLIGIGLQLQDEEVLATVLLLLFVPVLIVFTVILWMGEVERMVRAGTYLAKLERKVNQAEGSGTDPLGWEQYLRAEGEATTPRLRSGYHAIFVIFVLLVLASLVIGFYNAASEDWAVVLIPAGLVDCGAMGALIWWYVANQRRVRRIANDVVGGRALPA